MEVLYIFGGVNDPIRQIVFNWADATNEMTINVHCPSLLDGCCYKKNGMDISCKMMGVIAP